MNYRLINSVASLLLPGTVLAFACEALADTPGYGEKVVQWSVQSGETCEDVAKALYGSAKHKALVLRYNRVTCIPGAALKSGTTLVMPATVGERPTAKIASVKPDTVAKPPGANWSEATAGQREGRCAAGLTCHCLGSWFNHNWSPSPGVHSARTPSESCPET